jgi:hypothetical protein
VVVLGMHRSGTSAVAETVARLGLAPPDPTGLITPGPFNQRGYWESQRLVTINEAVLRHLGGTWSAPPRPTDGWAGAGDPGTARVRAAVQAFAGQELGGPHKMVKDPRLSITLPLWRTVLAQPPVAVLVLRDPLEVARSLERRDGFPLTLGLALWQRYVRQAVASIVDLAVFVVEYSDLLDRGAPSVEDLAAFLTQCRLPVDPDRVAGAAASLAPDLRHHRPGGPAARGVIPSALVAECRAVLETLSASAGGHRRWAAPALDAEPAWVDDVIGLVAAGQMVTYAGAAARQELTWIKRSRLFGATRALWRLTSTGPVLAPTGPVPASTGPADPDGGPSGAPVGRWADAAVRTLRSRRRRGSAIPHEDNPRPAQTLSDFRLFAVVKSWMDEDIIEATVRNALAQGVEAVYLVDNASTDATVDNAVAAGAVVAEIYDTDAFDGRLVQPLMNAVVARESLRCRAEHVWWLLLDSDEFPEGPGGLTVGEYLATLDRRFRLVGATFKNHVPEAKPEYLAGFHPIDFQPRCYTFEPADFSPCLLGHWKHPLQRFDRHGHFVLSNDGAHTAFCSDRLVEPTMGIVVHHFQYRDEARTRAKLELASGPGSTRTGLHEAAGFTGFVRRRRSLDAVYSQRWADVETPPNAQRASSLDPRPWPGAASVPRWYGPEEVEAARRQALAGDGPGPPA